MRKGCVCMSERATMKRRVRGLLHKQWLSPLAALALAFLPAAIVTALILWLVRPAVDSGQSVLGMLSFSDPRSALAQLLMIFSSPSVLFSPMIGWLPSIVILLCVHLFIMMPILVSLAGYFLSYLRGKNPRPIEVYSVFSGHYPRALGGMAYKMLWLLVWFAATFAVPTVLVFAGVPIVSALGIELSQQIVAFGVLLVIGLIWYIAGLLVFINRLLAYSLTQVCIAAQPKLPARRAVRLSRKLMRGYKWQLIGLYCSYLVYFIPAILALIALLLAPHVGPLLGLGEAAIATIRTAARIVFWANQLAWLYVGPYLAAAYHAFYIERKREALLDEEIGPDEFDPVAKASRETPEQTPDAAPAETVDEATRMITLVKKQDPDDE